MSRGTPRGDVAESGVIPIGRPFLRCAQPRDVPAMAALINGYAARGLMLPKKRTELRRNVERYVVWMAPDGGLAGCGGLRVYGSGVAEIVSLAVAAPWRGRGLGAELVERLVADARDEGIARVFAMTLSAGFFSRSGFQPIPRAWLAEKEAADCMSCARRGSCREVAMQRRLAPPGVGDRRSAAGIPRASALGAPAVRTADGAGSRTPWPTPAVAGPMRMALPVVHRAGG